MFDDLEADILVGLGLDKFRNPSSIVDEVIEERENPKKGIEAPWSKLHGLFEIPQQGITLFGGYSGHSKSTVINQWALHAAASGHQVAIASLELTNAHLYEMLSSQASCVAKPPDSYLAEFATWADNKLHIVDSHDVMKPDEVLELVRDSKRLLGCSLFILDCLFQVDLGGELEHEKAFFQQLAATLTTPFGASSFNNEETNRKTVDFRVTPELEEFLHRLDAWACLYLADNSERLFKGRVPEYRPCLQKKGDYTPTVRCKLNVAGQKACRFWSERCEKIEMPADLRECGLVPRVHAKSLYVMGREVGLVLEVTDLLCVLPTETCPFAEASFD